MANDESNPYSIGTDRDALPPLRSNDGSGLAYFFFAVSAYALASIAANYLTRDLGIYLTALAAFISLVLACRGFYLSMIQWDTSGVCSGWSTFLNFLSFALNMLWLLLILYFLILIPSRMLSSV